MRKILFFIALTMAFGTSLGQVTIWSEDFESYTNGTGVNGDGNQGDYPSGVTKWTLDVSDAHFADQYDYFKVRSINSNKELVIQDSDGTNGNDGIVYWYSESIDISAYSQVSINIDVHEDENENDLEDADFFRLQYRIDNGTWTTFTTNGYRQNDFTAVTGSETGLSGGTLEIRIKTRTTAGGEHIYFDNIIVKGNNADTEVYNTNSQPAADDISSLAVTDNDAVEVFQMEIQDQGSGDGLPTKVTNIRLKPHTTNTADWTDNIQGFVIYDNNLTEYTPASVNITDTYIDFAFNPGDLDVPDNGALDLSFYVYLNTSGIEDGKILSFMVDADDHGFTADSLGSDFTSAFTLGDFNSEDFTINVEATELQFIQQPTDVQALDVMTPSVTVAFTDENGNVDIDYDGSGYGIGLTTTGSFDSSATTQVDAVQGIGTFSNLKFDEAGSNLTLSSVDADGWGMTTSTSNTFNVTGGQEISVEGNGVEIVNGDTTPSQIDVTDFRHVRVAGNTSVSRTFTIFNKGDVLDLDLSGSPIVSISGTNASDFTVTQQPSSSTVGAGNSVDFTIEFNPGDYGVRTATVSIANNDSDENPYTFDIQGTGADYIDCSGIDYIQDFETSPAEPTLAYSKSTFFNDSSGLTANSLYPQNENYYVSGANALYIHGDNGGTLWLGPIDTRNYQEVSFTIRLAAFSENSNNGMDNGDYVTVLVSEDDGVNYSEEIKVKGNNNAKWSFDTGTGLAQVKYDGNNTPRQYAPSGGGYRTTDGYSTIRIRNLPKVEKLWIKIWTSENSDKEYWMFDDAKLIGRKATVWDGTAWNRGTPTRTKKAVINGAYDTTNGSIHTCECEVRSGKTLTISDNTNMLVETEIINFGSIVVTNKGSLVQRKTDAMVAGEGTYELDKTSLDVDEETDYVYWSSPLNSSTFTLGDIVANAWRYYEFDPNNPTGSTMYPGWVQADAATIASTGIGYAISAPSGTNATTQLTASFVKEHDPFNNGDITVNIYRKGSTPGDPLNYNLLGNPYPSAIDFNALANDPDNSHVEGSYYLWTNCAGLASGQHQVSGYTSYAAGSGTATAACSGSGPSAGQYIATGQGFFIEANTDNSTLTFKNTHRVTGNNDNFVNRPNSDNKVAWLNMTDDNGHFNQIAVGFYPGATADYDRLYDAHTMNDGTDFALYSVTGDHKLVINGMSDANIDGTTVPLTVEVTATSNLTISLDHQTGLDDYDVYLIDNDTQTTTDLKTNDYVFNLPAGVYNSRFELVFNAVTSVDDQTLPDNAIVLSQQHGVFTLQSVLDSEQIQDLTVYDINGRTLFAKAGLNSQQTQVDLSNLPNGSVVLFKIVTTGQKTAVKKAVKLK